MKAPTLLRALTSRAVASRHFAFLVGEPEPNWAFLLDPDNTEAIRTDCHNRKTSGNIDRVLELHRAVAAGSAQPQVRRELLTEALKIPNTSHPDSPIGDESKARLLREHIPSLPNFTPSSSGTSAVALGKSLSQLRLDNVTPSSGPRTYYFIGGLALLERALVQLALSRLVGPSGIGFTQISVPDILPANIIESCGFSVRGQRTQIYHVDLRENEESLCLAGTAEMSLAGFFAGHTFDSAAELPRRVCAVSRCYRREVALQEEPLYRVHQFTKVEMFGVTARETGDESRQLLEEMVQFQIRLMEDLQLQFRVLEMPTAELGAPAHRKVDVEVWMPGSGGYGEVSSASDCTDFQSRRLLMRYGPDKTFAGTVNGTAAAIPRLVKAILETHRTENDHVRIPEVLWPWMRGVHTLRRQHPPVAMTFIKRLRH